MEKKKRIAWNKGKKNSLEARKKMSESHKGKIPWNKNKLWPQEIIEKIKKSKSNISEETRKKMSIAKKGKKAWNKGLTKETNESVKLYGKTQSNTKRSEKWKQSNSYKNLIRSLQNPERCRKISEGRKKYLQDPKNRKDIFRDIEKRRISLINSDKVKLLDRASKPELLFLFLLEKNKIKYEFQKSIDNRFICDFYIKSHNLLIEINGYYHNKENDDLRRNEFEKLGYNVKMFYVVKKNEQIFNDFILTIKQY